MVTYEEQLLKIQQTSDFIATSNDTSINNQNVAYRNLYDKCMSDPSCNLEIFVAEHKLNPDKLDSSIIEPIKYTTLRQVLHQREILINAGYKLTNFDSNTFDETKSIKSQIQIISSPNINSPYFTLTKTNEVANAFDYISGFTTTAQNSQKDLNVNFDGNNFSSLIKDSTSQAVVAMIVGVVVVLGLGIVINKKSKKQNV